ncbi:hypothetical protein MP638_000513 [Amoeboaphelidium occidentale]|nr:hypothetical protein MP638_000513 [Amoeboaphelidium occidentale]
MNGLRRSRRLMNMAPTIDDVEEDDDDDDEIVIDVDVDDESIEDRNNNEDDDYVEDNESEGAQEPAVFVQREYEKTSTVSCGLRGLVKNKKLLPVIQEVVERINTILFHGSSLLNFYLIRELSEGRDLVLMTTGLNGKLRHFFTALLTSRQINYDQDVLRAADEYRALEDAQEIDFGSTAGITSLLNNAVQNCEVALMNSVTTTIHGRILRWLRHLLEVQCSVCFRNKKRRTSGAKYIMSYLAWQANERADKPEFPLLLDKFLARNDHLRVNVLAALLTARVELFSISYASEYSLSKDYIKESWYKYFRLLFHVLSYFNEHSIADAQGRLLERRCGRGLRRFTLAPLKKMRNGFILVDTTSLGENLAFAYARGRNRVPKSFPAKLGITQRNQTMLRNPGKYWKDVLKIDKLSNSSKTFGFSIKTDGVSARVHFKKTCYTTDVGKDGFKTFGDKEYVQLDVENKRVVGLDPGRKDMFSCHDGSKKSYHCSGKE